MATVGISMIVKNAEKTLRRALEPFHGKVDEIIAVDTGSTDSTVNVLKELGAKVSTFTWNDNFSDARNAALDRATTDWVLSLDSDEWVEPNVPDMVRAISQRTDIDAYFVETINFISQKDSGTIATEGEDARIAPAYTLSIKIRLTKIGPRWEGSVHELLDFDARRRGLRIALAPFRIRHDGMLGGGESAYYIRLCKKAYQTGNVHPGILFVLGLEAIRDDDNAGAERFWREAVELEKGFVKGYVGLSRLMHLTGRTGAAIEMIHKGLTNCALSTEIGQLFALAIDLHYEIGEDECVRVMKETSEKICPGDYHVAEALKRSSDRCAQ